MSIDNPPIPPGEEPETSKRKRNTLLDILYGLIILLVIIGGVIGLLTSSLFSGEDSLLTGLVEKIDQVFSRDPLIGSDEAPDQEDQILFSNEVIYEPGSRGSFGADQITLGEFKLTDLGISFSYPVGWEIEQEDSEVTFYHPEDLVFIYIGEFSTDQGTTAKEIAADVVLYIEEEAKWGTFELLMSGIYPTAISEDAYLVLFEWVDDEGDYAFVYDLEMVSGESNQFIFLYGTERDEMNYYGELLDIIAASMKSIDQ
jgi:hypothetical protein